MQTRLSRLVAVVALILGACGGGDGGNTGDDAVDPVDAAQPGDPDAAAPGTPDATPPTAPDAMVPEPSLCGSVTPDVSGITGTEGLAIAPDGTIYFSQSKAIGRWRPGQAVESPWKRITGAGGNTVWGLALTDTHLYVGYAGNNSLWRFDLTTGAGEEWLASAGQPNGVIIGADGALYYSDFAGDQVYRVDLATKERTEVLAASIAQPNGLYSIDPTHLLVLSYPDGDVWELTLRDGVETARTRKVNTSGRLDGITRGADGRWYITDNSGGDVLVRNADFSAPAGGGVLNTEPVRSAANLVFGRGALSCDDLYVTSRDGMQRITVRP